MTTNPATFTAQESTHKRRRWGCTCGCFMFLVAIFFATLGIAYYLFRPMAPSSADRWLRTATSGFGVVRVNIKDPGIADVMISASRQVEDRVKHGLPENDRNAVHSAFVLGRQFVGSLIHPDVYTYLVASPDSDDGDMLTVVQFRNLLAWLVLKSALRAGIAEPTGSENGFLFFTIPSEKETSTPVFALSHQALVVSRNMDLVKKAIHAPKRRMDAERPGERFQAYFDELRMSNPEKSEDVAFVLVNDQARFQHLLEMASKWLGRDELADQVTRALEAQKLAVTDVLGLRTSGDIISADKAKLTMTFYCRQPDLTRKLAEVLRTAGAQISQPTPGSKVTRKVDVKTVGLNAVLSIEFSGLKDWASKYLAAPAQAASETPTPNPQQN